MSDFMGRISGLTEAIVSRCHNSTPSGSPELVFDFAFEPNMLAEEKVVIEDDPSPSEGIASG